MKRLFDILLAAVLGAGFSIPMLILAIAVYYDMGSILFCQVRPGKNGVPFVLYKFKSMKDSFDSYGILLDDAKRVSSLGRFIRSTSLDELPSIYNVLIGNMSFVGPRPLLMEYMNFYSTFQMRRHEVKPGITGWAQVNGRNSLTWEEKFAYDVWYVDNNNFWLDIKILFMTILAVLNRKGVNFSKDVTMPKFNGSNKIEKE
jgi:lipopolysaccharide/colanic/teichoic acid biosynthesis glycosyltransferase